MITISYYKINVLSYYHDFTLEIIPCSFFYFGIDSITAERVDG